jgi:porin
MKGLRLTGVSVGLWLAATSVASAQSTTPPPSAPYLPDILGTLESYGINIRGTVINETAGNPTGGIKQGTTNVGQVQLGADFDLDRMLGIAGASIHVTEYHDYGSSLSLNDLGNGVRVQEIYKNPYNIFHFGLFTYEQKLLDDRIDIAVGRTATSAYFGHLDLACRFMSGTNCGIPALINSEAGFSLLPSATWGGKVSYQITPNLYAMIGAFEVNASVQDTNGFDWSISKATGVTVPVEFGYGTTFKTDAYPFDIKLGGYYSDGGHADPYYNTLGRPLALSGGTAENIQDRSGAYLQGDKTVWRGKDPAQNVTLLAGYVKPFDNTEVYTDQAFAGAVWSGPIASRPNDSIGFIANYFRVSDEEVAFLDEERAKLGGVGINNENEFTFELNYSYVMAPGTLLMPDLQYVIHPDNSALPSSKNLPADAWVIGLKAQVSFGAMN